MSEKTLTRADLTEAVVRGTGLARGESAEMVEAVLAEISAGLVRGETVKLSSFGTFSLRDKAQRMGRNPKTGVAAVIRPRRVVVFKASNIVKRKINDALTRRRVTAAAE